MKYIVKFRQSQTAVNFFKFPLRRLLWFMGRENLRKDGQRYGPVFDYITTEILLDGVFEKKILECLSTMIAGENAICKERIRCLDVGANVGNHSIVFSRLFRTVIAFEPNPTNFTLLSLNSAGRNIECFQYAVSDSAGSISLHTTDDFNSGAHSSQSGKNTSFYTVKAVTLDEFLSLGEKVDFIKIDTEGHEYSVLKGAEMTLRRDHPVIAFEQSVSEWQDGSTKSIELLKSFGYQHFLYLEKRFHFPRLGRLALIVRFMLILVFGDRYEFVKYHRTPQRFHDMVVAF